MRSIILMCLLITSTIAFGQAPNPNDQSTLFLKFSIATTSPDAYGGKRLIWNFDKTNKEWKSAFVFSSKDSKGRSINREFYVPNENVFWYVNPTVYSTVLKDNNQIRNILDGKRYPEQDDYFKAFSKIYLLDLEQPNPRNPSEFKLIEVKLYLPWEH